MPDRHRHWCTIFGRHLTPPLPPSPQPSPPRLGPLAMLYNIHGIFAIFMGFYGIFPKAAKSQEEANYPGGGGKAFENVTPALTPTNIITLSV